ncbi:MAG: hypothetical protein V8S98_05375 [Lachnospiraceae bacterium]
MENAGMAKKDIIKSATEHAAKLLGLGRNRQLGGRKVCGYFIFKCKSFRKLDGISK